MNWLVYIQNRSDRGRLREAGLLQVGEARLITALGFINHTVLPAGKV